MKSALWNAKSMLGRVVKGREGITGLETAIVLIAFVVVSSMFAFAALSMGLFSSDKAKETIQAGLSGARGSLEIRGERWWRRIRIPTVTWTRSTSTWRTPLEGRTLI